MCTEARPVRVAAIALRKSSTAFSIRVFSCTYVSFRPGIAAMVGGAIISQLRMMLGIKTLNYKRSRSEKIGVVLRQPFLYARAQISRQDNHLCCLQFRNRSSLLIGTEIAFLAKTIKLSDQSCLQANRES